MAEIQKVSLVDQVYNQLRRDIISLRRPLGSRLNVSELQNEFNVSCTPIREAINRLQQEGLVTYKNNAGASILSLSEHDVEEIQQLALTLHCEAMRLAMNVEKARPVIIAEIEKRLRDYKEAKTAKDEVLAVNRFIGTFYHNCGNERLDKTMIAIQGQQLLLRNMYADCCRRGQDAEYYEKIVEAVKADNTREAMRALRDHCAVMTKILTDKIGRK